MRHTLMVVLLTASLCGIAQAAPLADKPGGKDHPLVSRFQGSLLQNYGEISYEEVNIPLGPYSYEKKGFEKSLPVAGRVFNYMYWGPAGRSDLEVFRNFQSALKGAGFKELYVCDKPEICERNGLANYAKEWTGMSSAFVGGYNALTRMGQSSNDPPRFLVARLDQPSGTVTLSLTVKPVDDATERKGYGARYFLQIVESAAMATGQVEVDAEAIAQGLKAEGKIALYGLVFDTGKATIQVASQAALTEMAKALNADRSLRVYIVGHTDNQGRFEDNLALSRQRAEAVIAALRTQHGIAAERLQAGGVADMAPVASNTDEAGRSKNRRVEMVVR